MQLTKARRSHLGEVMMWHIPWRPSSLAADTSVDRRELLRFGTLAAVLSGTSALSCLSAAPARAETDVSAIDVRKGELFLNVRDYGAVGDGTADDGAAFNSAIMAANALGGNDRENIRGLTIFIPDGRYKIRSALDAITVSGIHICGASRNGTVLLLSSASTTFTWGNAAMTSVPVGGGLSNCKIEYLVEPTGGSVVTLGYAFDIEFSDLQLVRVPTLLMLGIDSSRIACGVTVRNVHGSISNAGLPLFALNFGAGLTISDSSVFVRGVPPPAHPTPMTTVGGTYAFACLQVGGFWDTVVVSNSLFERFDMGLIMVAGRGSVWQNFFFENTIFDYCKRQAIYAESQKGGVVSGIRFSSTCWFMSWESHSVEFTGPGYHDFHQIKGFIPISGYSALRYAITAKNCSFELGVGASSRKALMPGALNFAPGSTGFTVTSCIGGDDNAAAGLPWRSDYGIFVGAECDNYLVTGNRLSGITGGYNFHAVNSDGSANRKCHNNTGANYSGANLVPFPLPASGKAMTNKTPFLWDVYIHGGKVDVIAKNGTKMTGMTAGLLTIGPGESFTLTYSAAPSLTSFYQA